ncbi:unnamed protein product [Phaedon cochleariae]|uniref:Peptidase S1 domain-containing protein n=1 Tax=Phaedon cochleariae TaxID=80249 RepID=A0A9P0DTU3_PHACE|nr:unnamed protein product [Phaedon cochleariae]
MEIFIIVCFMFVTVLETEAFNNINFADVNCGKYRAARRFGKIVGGSNADKGEFPWLVSITRRGGHFCGGTVITNKFVMTAGHCLCTGIDQDRLLPTSIKITMAQHDLSHKDADAYQMAVEAITVHPGYECDRPKDDIAILEVAGTIRWSETVLPACLPLEGNENDFANLLATVAGWGWTNEDSNKGRRANNLQKAKINVFETNTCRAWYKSQGKQTRIQDSHICAGYENGGIDACWADSGGPLMVNSNGQNDQMIVVGVVSTGIGCARPYLPGIYTRVSDYIPWIRHVIGK